MNNAILHLDLEHLERKLRPFNARQYCAFHVSIRNAPQDVTAVTVRLFAPTSAGTVGTSYFDSPAISRPDGSTWNAVVLGTAFTYTGSGAYEVFATDATGNRVALAVGDVTVSAFSNGTSAATAYASQTVTSVTDSTGAAHTISAVYTDGEWTLQLGD